MVEFDLSVIEALQEDENSRVQRETALLDRGVLTINEVRRERNLREVPWGDGRRDDGKDKAAAANNHGAPPRHGADSV